MAKKLKLDLDGVIGLCRFCGQTLGESPPPACVKCTTQDPRRTPQVREFNPYSKTWNKVEDEEGELLAWVKNGTLFVPTWEEIGRRHMSKARYLLAKARNLGRTAEGHSMFMEAVYHRDRAKTMLDENRRVIRLAR